MPLWTKYQDIAVFPLDKIFLFLSGLFHNPNVGFIIDYNIIKNLKTIANSQTLIILKMDSPLQQTLNLSFL